MLNPVAHPLDPLSGDEFRAVASILQREHGVVAGAGGPAASNLGWRFASIELAEPGKTELRAFDDGGPPPPRRAEVICLQRSNNATYKSVVSLTDDRAESFEHIPGVQANFTVDEFVECDQLLRTHPDLIAALAKRGVTDMDLVFFDTWTYGDAVAPAEYRDRRLGWSDSWVKAGPGANPYANLISGLHCVIDLNSMELLLVEDSGPFSGGGVETPEVMGEYVPSRIPERIRAGLRRETLKPLHISQPEGPSFTLDGNLLQWQNWALRIGFNHREGMTLHTVRYRDGDRNRSVAHRLSFAEMIVPYRDPSEDHYRRTAFDIGEWGLGFMTTSLELGCDCLGEIRYLDAVLHNSKGEPYTITNAICIHEEDNAVLWKHVDHDIGRRGAPDAAADDLVPRHRRELRIPRLLAALPGRQHRMRGARHRHHGDHTARSRASRIRTARWSTNARMRRSTNTSWCPARHGHRRQRQHRLHDGVLRRADRPGQSARAFARVAQRAAAHREPGQAGRQLRDATWLEGGQHQRRQRARHPPVVQVGSERGDSADVRPRIAGLRARQRHRSYPVGDSEPAR